jgi:hypothetical protein
MKRFDFWLRWLIAVAGAIVVFGVFMALFNGTALFRLFNRNIDPVFWQTENIVESARLFRTWVYGAWGATIAGWGITLMFVGLHPFKRRELWAWNAITIGVAVWYVLDTTISLYFGVIFNAIFNTSILILAGLPLLFTRSEFIDGPGSIEDQSA